MIRIIRFLSVFALLATIGCSSYPQENKDVIFQTSTINALLEGVYDGELTCKMLKRHGNFGIGTFEGLDGEMIGCDGEFYQIKADGVAYPVSDWVRTPFAVVTFFEPDRSVSLDKADDYKQLGQCLDNLLTAKNAFYAIRIDGRFKYIKTRSVPKQSKPYPRLAEVVKNQPTFEFHNVEGTIIGFWCPGYVEGINVPGYHLHFITKDKKSGGHLLDCQIENVRIGVDYTSGFYMVLPESVEFQNVDLIKERQKELEKVER